MPLNLDTLVFWAFVFAWLVLFGLIVFGAIRPAVSEALRITRRVLALVNESPLPGQLAKAQHDALRISAAIDRLPALERRARDAVALIRNTPFIPPTVTAAIARVRRALRTFSGAQP